MGSVEPTPESAEASWVDALPQAVVLHAEGRVTSLNAAAARLWGVPNERARGRLLLEVVRRHTLESLARRGGELELEVGGRHLRCLAVSGALIVEDVTNSRRREAELREAAAVLSHEFRTPVTGLRGILEALQYDLPTELQQNFVERGLTEVERLGRLVEDLAVGFRPTRSRTLPLSDVLTRAERLVTPELSGAGLRLVRGEDALVRADPDKLLQVLLNLIENAVRHGPKSGVVRVGARHLDLSGTSSMVEVSVVDGGPGPSDDPSIWRAHTRGPSAQGTGSGMGLYIVRSIVEGWGGSAWVERRPEGNAFCFTVPGAN